MDLEKEAAVLMLQVAGECSRAAKKNEPPNYLACTVMIREKLSEVAKTGGADAFFALEAISMGRTLKVNGEHQKKFAESAAACLTKIHSNLLGKPEEEDKKPQE